MNKVMSLFIFITGFPLVPEWVVGDKKISIIIGHGFPLYA